MTTTTLPNVITAGMRERIAADIATSARLLP